MTAWTATVQGVTIGAGTNYRWASMPDGFGINNYRFDDIGLPRQDGMVAGDDRLGGRTFAFDVWILGNPSSQTAETRALTLKGAFQPLQADVQMTFALSDLLTYTVTGRPRSCDVVLDKKFLGGTLRARCTFWCSDPRLFGGSIVSPFVLPSGGTGLTFNATTNFTFGSAGSGGINNLINAGTYPTDWSAVFVGPLTDPVIEHIDQSATLGLSLVLGASDTLTLDSRTRSVLLNGTASRYSALTPGSRWFQLTPGSNTIRFRAGTGSGSMSVTYRPAYL